MKRKRLLITVSVLALVAAGTGLYVAPLMADPAGDKDCGSVLPGCQARPRRPCWPPRSRNGRSAAGR